MSAVISGWVWVDGLSAVQRENLRAQLTIYPKKTTDIAAAKVPAPIELWREDGDRFAVPRGFWRQHRSGRHDERLVVSYGQAMQPLASTWTAEGPFAEQAQIIEALQRALTAEPWGGGLLEAACGTGKSEVGIELAHRIGCSTMILVHKEFLLRQWRKRIQKVLPGARVGIVQQDRCEWEGMDFCIALMQSLVRDDGCGAKYDPRMYQGFGLVLVDEAHHVPSATFSQVLPRFYAAMLLGLSATFRRKDGTEDVFYHQLGPVIYTATAKPMIPQVRVIRSDATLKPIRRGWNAETKEWSYEVEVDALNSAQVLTHLAEDEPRQRLIVDQVLRAVQAGRKILVVSERLEHLRDMARVVGNALSRLDLPWVPTQDYYTGQWFTGEVWNRSGKGHRRGEPKKADRSEAELEAAEGAQVLWATRQMCVDGESIVTNVDTGEPVVVHDIVPGIRVLSYREETGEIQPVRVSKVWETGERKVLEFKIGRAAGQSCKKVRTTGEHRILTQRGWLPASDIVVGDWFMAAARFSSDHEISKVCATEAALIGYFIGDGGVSQLNSAVASFANIDADIVSDVRRLLVDFDAHLEDKKGDPGNYMVRMGGKRRAGSKSKFRLLMEKHGIAGCRAWEKTLSSDLLWCDSVAAGALIGALVSTDGSVSPKRFHVMHSSSSRVLAYQIQQLLLRNGIVSFVRRSRGTKNKPMAQWKVSVSGSYWVRKLALLLRGHLCPRKQALLDSCLRRESAEGGFGRRVPEERWTHAMRVWRASGKQKKDLGKFESRLGASVHRNGVDASILEFITAQSSDATLKRWARDDGTWERVYSISDGGIARVYDLQMEHNGNFVCDGVVVHNCDEGFDVPACDVLVLATPVSDAEQVVGRVQRWCKPEPRKCARLCPWRAGRCEGKPVPVVVDVVDPRVVKVAGKWRKRQRLYQGMGIQL